VKACRSAVATSEPALMITFLAAANAQALRPFF